ncbi:MAG: ABC transporter permease [Pseudoruegeria sp.]
MQNSLIQQKKSEVSRTSRSVLALILREMATTYGRSPGGYIWAIVEPVAAIALLSLVFGVVMRTPPLGNSFPLFYATGYLPFTLYTDVAGKCGSAIKFSRPLLAYPRVSFIDTILARYLLNTLTQVLVFYIIVTGILTLTDARAVLDLPSIGLGLLLASFLGVGIGCLNCYLTMEFPIWATIWSIINRPMFLISGIFFLYDDMPRFAQDILWYNPLLHVVGLTRSGFYATYDATYVSLPYVVSIAGVSLILGLLLLRRNYKRLLQK